MFRNAFKGKRIFITGHTGFKGSWLTAWLLDLGATVAGFSVDIPTEPSHFLAMRLGDHILDIRGDIRDRETLIREMQAFKPDILFHLAAQALVRKSYDDPAGTFEANALGTLNILEAVRKTPSIACVILITSDKCYRNDEQIWGYRENDALGGTDPYSASKGCAELIAHSYFSSFFTKGPACATVRAGNVIGGGDWACDRVVPDCARSWNQGVSVILRNPNATRPWQHVLEPLSGYLHLASSLLNPLEWPDLSGQAFNFGPDASVHATVADLVKGLALHWPGFTSTIEQKESMRKECTLLKLCCDKALGLLDWKATLTLDETIRETAIWYHTFYRGGCANMLETTLGQIHAYTNTAKLRSQIWTK
ncbi:MAG: CDP-glucose 4,6-dehydratase [Desulfovibrionaceae bacterium]|nr:CDP-glucose 4,6-dehydratase [Desulfovibrionaceae bacterium]